MTNVRKVKTHSMIIGLHSAHTHKAMILGLEFRSMTVVTVMKSHVHIYEKCGNITVGIKLGNCGQKAVDR